MSHGRMWTYPELRFATVNQHKLSAEELAAELNRVFHGGQDVRAALDVQRIQKGKTIFNKEKNRGRGVY